MKRYFFVIIFVLLFLLIIKTIFSTFLGSKVLILSDKEITDVNVDVADTIEERNNGLKFRKDLQDDYGMLFVFDKEDFHTMWMKDTLIPLDMIFISDNFRIVDIKYAYPCKQDPCELYKPNQKNRYVLEVSGNYTIKKNIKIGDRVNIYARA